MIVASVTFVQKTFEHLIFLSYYNDSQYVIFFISEERPSIEVNSESVTGNLHEILLLNWTVKKVRDSDKIESAALLLGKNTSDGKELFQGVYDVGKSSYANKKFGDRIKAWWDGLDFKLRLKNIQHHDTVSFTLVVSQTKSDLKTPVGKPISKTISITTVNGTYMLFECLCNVTECMALSLW